MRSGLFVDALCITVAFKKATLKSIFHKVYVTTFPLAVRQCLPGIARLCPIGKADVLLNIFCYDFQLFVL